MCDDEALGIIRWRAWTWARKAHWDVQDLMQEGWLLYARIRDNMKHKSCLMVALDNKYKDIICRRMPNVLPEQILPMRPCPPDRQYAAREAINALPTEARTVAYLILERIDIVFTYAKEKGTPLDEGKTIPPKAIKGAVRRMLRDCGYTQRQIRKAFQILGGL